MYCECDKNFGKPLNKLLSNELKQNITFDEIFNESEVICIELEAIEDPLTPTLSSNDLLALLDNKMGIYVIWVVEEQCADHDLYKMLAAYVGKGKVGNRVKDHIKKKLKAKDESYYISFYSCENRIAKYLEQAILDLYKVYLNTSENIGTKNLKTLWTHERIFLGTKFKEKADKLEEMFPEMFSLEDHKLKTFEE